MILGMILMIGGAILASLSVFTIGIPICGGWFVDQQICFNEYGGTTLTLVLFFSAMILIGYAMNKGESDNE